MTEPVTEYLGPQSVTDVARIVMALMSEVWIMRDRQIILEHLLEQHGAITSQQIDEYNLPHELVEKITAERERYARLVAGAPLAGVHRSVADILERAGLDAPPSAREKPDRDDE